MAYETTDQLIAEISDHWVKDPRGNLYKLIDTYNGGFEHISDMANRVEKGLKALEITIYFLR